MGVEEGIHPYIHNRKGRVNAQECGCEECRAALHEYWAQEEEVSSRYWKKVSDAIEEMRIAMRKELMDELRAEGKLKEGL